MDKNAILLLRTLLLSTSGRNTVRFSKDRKKIRKIKGGKIGRICIFLMLAVYSGSLCYGLGVTGLVGTAPEMCALTVSVLAFVFTLIKTNGYLFNFKEYDMLMSLPFEAKTVASSKFLYMYIKSLPWFLSVSLPMLAVYVYFVRPFFFVCLLWIILSFFLPIIPMLAASFLGFLIARISSGFRKTNMVQTVLTMIFVIFCFSLRFIIEDLFKNDKVAQTMASAASITGTASSYYLPAAWFTDAVTKQSVISALLLVFVTSALFTLIFTLVGRSYRNINSALKSHAASKKYRMTTLKQRSVAFAVAHKEYRRLLGSTAYMVNGAMGEVLAVLVGLVTLIIGADRIIALVTQGAPVTAAMLAPAVPFLVYFFIGMLATTACSPSLEGKNYWIVQSFPIEKKTLYQGKMLFNMMLTVPCMAFSTLCFCISGRVGILETLLYLLHGFLLCCYSTARGCACGIKHMKLDWENEIEVIKQGAAATIYLLPNMFADMAFTVLAVILGLRMNHVLLSIIFIILTAILSVLSYLRAMRLAGKEK